MCLLAIFCTATRNNSVFAWYPPLWTDVNNTNTHAFNHLAPKFYSHLSDTHGYIVDYQYYLHNGNESQIAESKAKMDADWVKARSWFNGSNWLPLLQTSLEGNGIVTQLSEVVGRDWTPLVNASLSFGK